MMTKNLKLTLSILLLAFSVANCDRFREKNDKDINEAPKDLDETPKKPSEPPKDPTETASLFSKSKYCPAETPVLAEEIAPPYRFDADFLDTKLKSDDGMVGWIHGAVHPYRQYIFTYRKEDPNDFMAFFKAQQFSLIGETKEVWDQFKTLSRHDKVRLKGEVFKNGSAVVHFKVKSVEVIKKYDTPITNSYTFDPAVFSGADKLTILGQVHATASSPELGEAIIVEKDNYIFPVSVDAKHVEVAKKVMKGDIVSVDLKVLVGPGRQPHFKTDADSSNAITIVDALINCHNLQKEVTGHLVKFDKSPAISTDVYAVRVVDGNGIARNMTFFPDVDADSDAFAEVFQAISAKAKAAWEASQAEPSVVRNFNEKKSIKVVARGKINVVSSEQANAQVYLKSADDVTFTVE